MSQVRASPPGMSHLTVHPAPSQPRELHVFLFQREPPTSRKVGGVRAGLTELVRRRVLCVRPAPCLWGPCAVLWQPPCGHEVRTQSVSSGSSSSLQPGEQVRNRGPGSVSRCLRVSCDKRKAFLTDSRGKAAASQLPEVWAGPGPSLALSGNPRRVLP